jgi:O-antigen/teichoic acid export membrane protein
VVTQAVTAAGLLVLPGLSYDFGRGLFGRIRRKALIVSSALCAAGLGLAAGLWMVAGRAEQFLFGGKYAAYAWLMPVLALIPAANGLTMGFSAALRASQRPHFDLMANAIAAPVAIVSAMSFIRWWGLGGAAASMVMGFVVYMGVNCWIFYATRQSEPNAGVWRGVDAK